VHFKYQIKEAASKPFKQIKKEHLTTNSLNKTGSISRKQIPHEHKCSTMVLVFSAKSTTCTTFQQITLNL